MKKNLTLLSLITLLLSGCFSEEQKQTIKNNRIELGDIKINYYSDKSVTSLEIPPDLTSPSYENSFRISEFVKGVEANTVNLTNKDLKTNSSDLIIREMSNITVRKSGERRWLVVDKSPEISWELSEQFLKDKGFTIKRKNKKIGLIETNYLENKPQIPAKSLGFIRSFFAESIENVSYTLPSVDSYKIRIEPIDSGTKSEVHLSLHSMAEVTIGDGKNESTMWQLKEKDLNLEAEMLYSLMLFLGGDSAKAREKIINAQDEGKVSVKVEDSLNGYAKLVFELSLIDTWDNISWALTEANIDIEDKDLREKTFYIKSVNDSNLGFMSKIFGSEAVLQEYQIQLKEINQRRTEVYFNDLSEKNETESKKLSYSLFKKLKKLF